MNTSLLMKRLWGFRVHQISIDNTRTPFGELYNEENHWVKTLHEYASGIRDYKQTSLYKFHQEFQPKSIFSLLDIQNREELEKKYPLGMYPWGRWTQKSTKEQWLKSRHCGPTLDESIKKEFEDFCTLFEKIKKEGVDFKKNGYPSGFIMKNEKDSYFIVLGGNHRIAICKYLGFDTIEYKLIVRRFVKQIVKRKSCKLDYEQKIFDRISFSYYPL